MKADSNPPSFSNCFVGGGEMGERIRAFDWSETPLGPIELWSQSLRTTVNLMLNSRYPMFVWWGRELINFYNDAYIPVLGARHPNALGRSAPLIWTEIWDVVGRQAEIVMVEGRATWNENLLLVMERYGYTEETYFTFSYSPVIDDGHVGGVFCACTEDTKRVLGERRLRTLRALAEQAAQAKSAEEACAVAAATLLENPYDLPFAMLYLLDPDGAKTRLAGTTISDVAAIPFQAELCTEASETWPLRQVAESGESQVIDNIDAKFGQKVKLLGGAWPEPVRQAIVLPMARPGQAVPSGFLIAGISPRLPLDDDYYGFLALVAGHIATAIVNARAYEEERRRAEALAELDRAKTTFFSDVSHEFRTPLTLMLGPLEDELREHPETGERLWIAYRNSLRLLKLVNTLLDFSRIEAGRMEANYEPTDLAATTIELASVFRSAIEKAGLELVVDCPALPEAVYVDREMWEKIVLNLISNAFKFTFEGRIEIRLSRYGEHVELSVIDTGVGIPQSELPKVFDRFHRVRDTRSRTQEGTGIGLALVQELARLHGGTVAVESEEGKGTAFTVSVRSGKGHLPAERISARRTSASTAVGAAPFLAEALRWLPEESSEFALSGSGSKLETPLEPLPSNLLSRTPAVKLDTRQRVVVADDNADMREYLRRLLSRQYEVETVADGESALAAGRARQPDLVLADVMMPGMDGFALLRAIREDAALKTIPVIMLSARAGEEARVEGLDGGADDYLIKPFSARELLARVESHVKMARLRREADRSLRESENRFRTFADTAPAMLWITEPDGSCSFLSRGWYEFTGQGEEEALGFSWLDALHPEDREGTRRVFLAANARQEPFALDHRIRRADGEHRWAIAAGRPRLDAQGNFFGYIGSVIDVHERKCAEEQAARLATILEASPDFVGIADAEGRVQYINPAGLRLLGFEPDEFPVHIEDVHDPEAFRLVRETGIPTAIKDSFWSGENTFKTRDGRNIPTSQVIIAHKDASGAVAYLSTIGRDLRALKELDQRKDEFLANMSHEIRSPLTGIMGYADLLLTRLKDPFDIQCLKTIKESGDYLIEIVNDILDLSKIEAGKLVLNMEAVSPHEVLGEIHGLMDVRAREKELPLVLRYEGVVPVRIETDRTRLRQIVINLVSNAIKFTELGQVEIVVRFMRDEEQLQVEVIDSGIGIGPEHQAVLFQPFTQADSTSTRRYGGTGLGLTITKRLVEMLGGSISFKSELGKGSTFSVAIPTGPPQRPAKTPEVLSRGPMLDDALLRDCKVLVIDDRKEFRYLIGRYIEDAGGQVRTVGDGKEAMETIEEAKEGRPFDAVLLDIQMPGMDGYEVARDLRAKGYQTPIIALTAGAMVGEREKCLRAGCDDYLTKPIDRQALVNRLAHYTKRADGKPTALRMDHSHSDASSYRRG